MVNVVIGATRNWAKTVLLWNLALDQRHGPVNGGCADCRGVVTLHTDSSRVIRNVEYYVLGHAARFVRPGAYRVGSTQPPGNTLLNVAFLNPDGSRVLLVLNNGAAPTTFRVQEGPDTFHYTLPAGSVATFTWQQPVSNWQ
jgi:glucosylceramidase